MPDPGVRKAVLHGVVAGTLVLIAGVVWLSLWRVAWQMNPLPYVLGIIVAPTAAAISATTMQAGRRRMLALAGVALLLAFATTNVVDYALTLVFVNPWLPGPYARGDLSEEQVAGIADRWLLGRHVAVSCLMLLGGSLFGARWGRRPGRSDQG